MIRTSHLLFVPQLGLQLLNFHTQLGVFLLLLIGFFTLSFQLHDLHTEPREQRRFMILEYLYILHYFMMNSLKPHMQVVIF